MTLTAAAPGLLAKRAFPAVSENSATPGVAETSWIWLLGPMRRPTSLGMLSSSHGVKGVVLRGVDPATAGRVLALPKEMVSGKLDDLNAPGIFPGIIVGKELAERLGLNLGDTINLM